MLMFYIVLNFKEYVISLWPDVRLRWGLDQIIAFKMDKWLNLKAQSWLLSTCDSFPSIVSHMMFVYSNFKITYPNEKELLNNPDTILCVPRSSSIPCHLLAKNINIRNIWVGPTSFTLVRCKRMRNTKQCVWGSEFMIKASEIIN